MIYIIAGQTASGKTELAIEFAKQIGAQIINGDAFQVYQKLDIGTAKPSIDERKIVPHHLFDIVPIDYAFSIFEYQKRAREIIDRLIKNNIPVVIVGGSGLYIRSVLFDYRFSSNEKPDMTKYSSLTDDELYHELQKIDPISANKIHPNNRRRVMRALEIYLQTGLQKSQLEADQSKTPYYPYLMVAINITKEELGLKITKRVKEMFAKGLRNEVMGLLQEFASQSPGLKAIGYKEIITNPDLNDEELVNIISRSTIQYAKRQMTFFKNQFDLEFFDTHAQALQRLIESHRGEHHENN